METTYTIYMLVENDVPYYVGCTSLGDKRYWGDKRKQFEALDTTIDNRLAVLLEMHWADMLRSWGFNLKNDRSYRPYPIKEETIKRAELQKAKMEEAWAVYAKFNMFPPNISKLIARHLP